jgi:hypothetical protein
MVTIEWGSIEVVQGDTSTGFPIQGLYPLDTNNALSSQVKGRTGVNLGSQMSLTPEESQKFGPQHQGSWHGTTADGKPVIVRLWKTDL